MKAICYYHSLIIKAENYQDAIWLNNFVKNPQHSGSPIELVVGYFEEDGSLRDEFLAEKEYSLSEWKEALEEGDIVKIKINL